MIPVVPIIDRQIDAYNRRDLEGFVACYTPDAELFHLADQSLAARGHEEMRALYRQRFVNPGLHAIITNRMVLGSFIIDYENITGIAGVDLLEAIVIYQLCDGLIARVWFIRAE